MTDVPPEDPRDALVREQAQLIETQAGRIAALEAVVADLRTGNRNPRYPSPRVHGLIVYCQQDAAQPTRPEPELHPGQWVSIRGWNALIEQCLKPVDLPGMGVPSR